MNPGTQHGVLLICDISGYTQFVRKNTRSASHARRITVRLLNALVAAAERPLDVAELEGDAVFFSALGSERRLPELAAETRSQIPGLFRAFSEERRRLASISTCQCEACSSIGALTLKQVVHAGPVSRGKVGGFEKLFGLAVIVVHRMLKSSIPLDEYLAASEPAYAAFRDLFELEPERHLVELEGLGEQEILVFPAEQILAADGSAKETTGSRRGARALFESLRWSLGLRVRTLIDAVS
jgi:hypothetical protein